MDKIANAVSDMCVPQMIDMGDAFRVNSYRSNTETGIEITQDKTAKTLVMPKMDSNMS